MSITFDRRTFLKTGAALVGATALMGLTGCDSDTTAPTVNKLVDTGDKFKMGNKIEVDFTLGWGGNFDSKGTSSFTFPLENLTDKAIVLYSDAFSASCNGNALRLLSVDGDISSSDVSPVDSVTLSASNDVPTSVTPTFALPTGANADDVIFKFHYGDKSIKFQNKRNGDELYTSGVYTDKVKF